MARATRRRGLALAGAAGAIALVGAFAWAQESRLPTPTPDSDEGFIRGAVQADTDEILMGQMLEDRGASPQVRAYGQMLVQDHTQSRQAAEAAAHAMGVVATETVDADGAAADRDLRGRSGADFDREAKKIAIADHQKVIARFEHEATDGHGPAAEHARQTLPVLHRHLDAAEQLPG